MRQCSRCGHPVLETSSRQLSPGLFECTSLIDMSHPGGPGGQWIHGARPCGHRFQSGHASGIPCAVSGCGFDSLATCQGGCGRRLCYAHANVCPSCRREQGKRKEAETAALRAAEEEAANGVRRAASAVAHILRTSDDARELGETMLEHSTIGGFWRWSQQ
jgi:hypothetical protein